MKPASTTRSATPSTCGSTPAPPTGTCCAARTTIGHATGPRADLYLEGSDQHRGWFHSSLLTGCAIDNHAPYRELLTHGFTVDENGRKMSKSLGNVIEPEKVNDTLGADILRLWVAATDYSGEMAVSEQILQRSADAYRRIRNTARFLLQPDRLQPGHRPAAGRRHAGAGPLGRGPHPAAATRAEEHYGEYRFWNVYSKIHNFCVQELGGFYLDIIKDRQYTTGANSVARRSARPRCSTSAKRWCAGSRRSWRSPPTKSGSTCRASATSR
jgi:isoleucyl-tRNA synthetase